MWSHADRNLGGADGAGRSELDPHALRVSRKGSHLCLAIDGGGQYENISVMRAFPWSAPDRYWSVQTRDGREIGLIAEPGALARADRALLIAELELRYFVPEIRRIVSIEERGGELEWAVETNRGGTRFTTRALREVVIQPVPYRYLITDTQGNRYDIGHIHSLDKQSQMLFMGCL